MDYSKIRLENERSTHVTKRMNRNGAWGVFKIMYRDNLWRLFGFSFLMLFCIVPVFLMQFFNSTAVSNLEKTLPNLGSFGFSTGVWEGLGEFHAQQKAAIDLKYGFISVAVSILGFVVLSGGFAVIRDDFWTGKLSTVGVFKSMGKGIAANAPYAIFSMVIVSFGVFGLLMLFKCLAEIALWLAIVLTILLGLLMLFVVCYLMILCSVSVTYKQSVAQNLSDSWRLLWMNVLPNLSHLVVAFLPIPLFFIMKSGMLYIVYLVFMMMFGGLYFPLVWQTYMMRVFALFHPVEPKKKKDVQREEKERLLALEQAREEAKAAKAAKKHKNVALAAAPVAAVEETPAETMEEPATDGSSAEHPVEDAEQQIVSDADITIEPPVDIDSEGNE